MSSLVHFYYEMPCSLKAHERDLYILYILMWKAPSGLGEEQVTNKCRTSCVATTEIHKTISVGVMYVYIILEEKSEKMPIKLKTVVFLQRAVV